MCCGKDCSLPAKTSVEDEDTESFVTFKFIDPDGYRVEVFWEDLDS